MDYERKIIERVKRRISSLEINPEAVTNKQSRKLKASICAISNDNHVVELLSEAFAKHPERAREFLVEIFHFAPNGLRPVEAAIYDDLAAQLQPFEDQAIQELLPSDKSQDEAELRDAEQRYQDLKEEDHQYRNSRQ